MDSLKFHNVLSFACYIMREWNKRDLTAQQIVRIKNLRYEMDNLCKEDIYVSPWNEYQKLCECKSILHSLLLIKPLDAARSLPKNSELLLLQGAICRLTGHLIEEKAFIMTSLSEDSSKDYFNFERKEIIRYGT